MRGLGALEAVVMDRLWSWHRPATVRQVLEDLRRDRSIAYTTVMTVMDKLHTKGWLSRSRDGRAYLYEVATSREAYAAELMRQVMQSSGDETGALLRFITDSSPEEAATIRQALRSHR